MLHINPSWQVYWKAFYTQYILVLHGLILLPCEECNLEWTLVSNSMEQLREKLIVTKLVNKFPALYGNQRFITVITKVHHQSLSWDRWIQSTPFRPIFLRFILISFCLYLGLPSGLFSSDLPIKILYTFLISPIHATCCMYYPSHPPWFAHPNKS
jgi:hypothetical protein